MYVMLWSLGMGKLLWLLVVLLLPWVVFGYTTEDLNTYMEDAIEDYKVKLHKATQTSVRVRRSIDASDLINTNSSEGAFMSDISNITAWQSIPTSYPMELEPFQIHQDNYMAVVNFKSAAGDYLTNSAVYHMDANKTFHLLQNFTTSGGIDFEYADLGREQYAIFLDHIGQNMYGGYKKHTYMKSFKMNQFLPHYDLKRPFQYRTKVRALGAKKVKVFTKDMNHYFITANSIHEDGDRYHVKSTMHVQTAYGYQLVQEFATQGAQDVEVEVIDGRRFVFFANQMDNSGSVDIYSTIFVENPSPQPGSAPFVMFQRIGTHGARDMEYFSFSGHHYLAVANEYTHVKGFDGSSGQIMVQNDYNVDSVIYWWTGTMWVQWQRIPTYGAVKWSFFESSFGDPMLVVANSKSQPMIFTYDYTRGEFIPTQVQDLSPVPGKVVVADTRSVMPFRTRDKQLFLAVANYDPLYRNGYNLFKVTFSRKPAPKVDPTIPEIITKNLAKMRDELNVVQDSLRTLLSDVKLVMTRTTDQDVTSPQVTFMDDVTVTDTLSTSNFYYHDNSTKNPLHESNQQIMDLRRRLEEQESKMVVLQSKFDDAVLLNRDTNVTGTKTFTTQVHIKGDLATRNVSVNGTVNGIKLSDLNTRTMKKSTRQTLHSDYTFTGNLSVGNAQVDSLNGVRMRDFMTTSTNQNVSGVMTFNDSVEIGVVMLNDNFTLNQVHIPRDVVTRNGNETITGHKFFRNITAKDLRTKGRVHNVNITDFKSKMVTLTTNQTTNSNPVFLDGFSALSDISIAGLVDGVNLTSLARNKSDDVEIMSGSLTFDNVRVKGSVLATEMNGRDVRRMFTLNTTQNISAVMNFTSHVVFDGDVGVGKKVNGLDISEDVVLKHGNQTIGGHKHFSNDISVTGNVLALGFFDGVDLEEWQRNAVMKGNSSTVSGMKFFTNGAQVSERLQVDTVNNISMHSLKQGKLLINKNGSTWTNRFHFTNITVGELQLNGKLSGYRVPDDFVPLRENMTISGEKHFVGKTEILGNLSVAGHLTGNNFSAFYDGVVKNNTDEGVTGNVIFQHNTMMRNNVTVSGKINGLSLPDDVVTLHTYQNLSNSLTLTTDTTFENGVTAHVVEVNETVNGIDVADMERNAIYKDRNQTINSSVIFIGGIDCKQNLSVSGLINGINLTHLLTTTVRVSQDQNISGIKTFTEDLLVEAPVILSSGTINGVNIKELDQNALKKSGDQTVDSDVVVNGGVLADSVNVAPTSPINNANFTSFVENAARTNEANTIHGDLEYQRDLVVRQLSAPRVDGVATDDILLTKWDQVVSGNVSFVEAVMREMHVNGLVNGLIMREVEENALTLDGDQNITGLYTFKNIDIDGNVGVSGYLNDVNLTAFDASAVHLSSDEVISGKHFDNVTFDNVTFAGTLNDVDVDLLFTDVLRKKGHQTVCHTIRFQASITSSNTSMEEVTVDSGMVNGVNIRELDEQAVKLSGNQILDGLYEFLDGLEVRGNLSINGTVNNRTLPDDFMTTAGDQIITGTKTFSRTKFSGHLNMSGFIDGVNISEVERRSFSLSRDQTIDERLKFKSVLLESDVVLPNKSKVNGIDISESLVSTVSDSVVKGKKTFNWTYVSGDLQVSTGTVNNVNITHLAQNSLKRSSSTVQEMWADQVFERNLVIKGNLNVSGLINGIQVTSFKDYSKNIGSTIRKELQQLSHNTKQLCNATTTLLPVAITEQTLTGIEKMDVFQAFPADSYLGKIDSKRIGDMVYISVARSPGAPCGPAYIIRCTPSLMCSVVQTIMTNAATMEFLSYQTFEALLVWHWKSGTNTTIGSCKQEPEIYTLNPVTGTFQGYGSLNYLLFQSEMYAPFIGSSVILAAYFFQHRSSLQEVSSTSRLPLEIKFFDRDGKNYLVVGSYEDNSHFVDILNINGTSLSSVRREQRFKTDGGSVSVGELDTGKHVVATSTDGPKGNIKLYTFNERLQKFEFYQRLQHSASSVKIQKISDKPYLMYTSAANGYGLCEWRGVSGFGACVQMQLTDTSSIEPIITPYGAFTVAGTRESIVVFRSKFAGNSKPYHGDVC